MPSNPSIGWQKLLYAYYNIRTCYDSLNWPVSHIFFGFKLAISSNSTLVALADKLVAHPSVIEVYSISGNKIWTLFHNATALISDFCFHGENLLVVLDNFKFRLYTDFDKTFNEYSFNDDFVKLANISDSTIDIGVSYKQVITNLETNETEEPLQIVQTFVWGDFLTVRYWDKLTVTHLKTFANYEIPLVGMDPLKIHSVSYLSSTATHLECLLSYESTVYLVRLDTAKCTFELVDKIITVGPFSMIRASPSGNLVALFNNEDSKIFVSNKEFDRELLIYDTLNESSAPYMMEWAGDDAIILSLREEIKLIGPQQSSLSFFYDVVDERDFDLSWNGNGVSDQNFTVPIIKSEKDGLKIITDTKVEFLSRVSNYSIDLFLVGSSHPSSILLDCVDKLLHQSSKADTNISYLKSEGSLETAMAGCLGAVLDEFSPIWQKKILKAVSFGKIYSDKYYNADEYLKALNTVRVLNQLRSPEIGLFLTYQEVLDIGWPEVIRMLLRRSQHLIAVKVIELLDLTNVNDLVFVDWCCKKIMLQPDMPPLDLFKIIVKKLLSAQGNKSSDLEKNKISVAEIFKLAQQEGRIDLCKLLVDIEPTAMQKVILLLEIDEVELALIKCFQSIDADLCRLLMLYLKDTMSLTRFLEILNQVERKSQPNINVLDHSRESQYIRTFINDDLLVNGDTIGNFWEQSIAKNDLKTLEWYYKYDDRNSGRKKLKLQEYLSDATDSDVIGGDYDNYYETQKAKLQALSGDRKLSKLLNIELDLLETKRKLSETYQQSFFQENSVIAVVEKLISMKQLKVAGDVCRNHKIPPQKLWNLVLEKYCKEGEFERLHTFILKASPKAAKILKAPISFETIAETCIFYNAPRENVSAYIGSCTDVSPSRRAELYLKNDDLTKAAEEAMQTKDYELLNIVGQKAQGKDDDIVNSIQQYLARI